MPEESVEQVHTYMLVFEACHYRRIEKRTLVVDLGKPIEGAEDIELVCDNFKKSLQEEGQVDFSFALVNIIRLPV